MRLALGLGLPYGGEAGVGVPGGSPASKALIDETDGLALSFVDDYFFSATGHYGSARVKDTSTPANNYNSHPFGLLTYAGASKKWVRGPNGLWFLSDFANDLPFEWDESGKLLGIRVEEQRVSRALKSRRLDDQTFWTATDITTSAVEGVDGVTGSATRITATDDGGTILGSMNTASSGARRLAPFIRRVAGTGNLEWTLDGGSTWTAFEEEITSSFKRIGVGATVANPRIGFRIASNGDAFDIDFANGEDGRFDTSPLESTDSHVTRAADNISLATSAFPYSQTEGTIVAEWQRNAELSAYTGQSIAPRVWELHPGAITGSLFLFGNPATSFDAFSGGSLSITDTSVAANTFVKDATAWKANDCEWYRDGSQVGTDTSVTIPSGITTLAIGTRFDNARALGGHIKSLLYVPRRMTNTELQTLTGA